LSSEVESRRYRSLSAEVESRRYRRSRRPRRPGAASAPVYRRCIPSQFPAMPATALVMHEDCALHDTGWRHPEHQGRLPAIINALYQDTPDLQNVVLQLEGVPVDESVFRLTHSSEMLELLALAREQAKRTDKIVALDSETLVSPVSWEAMCAAAGSVMTACEAVIRGDARNGFALARPPGHHATPTKSMGFCLVNNIAIVARMLQERGVERVLIVDWDVHHGNGTQDIFYRDPSVYFMSFHQYPWYPGTGARTECGEAEGEGFTRNVPLEAGTTGSYFRDVFQRELDAVLQYFTPDFVLVSAGFDCLRDDPLGQLLLEPADLHASTTYLMSAIPSGVGIVHTLEGGYNPPRVGAGVVDVVRALAGLPPKP
jgi:acetoin utilization deacetylase AcuC-like enzyme